MISPVIIVGVDSSPASQTALLWAAAEAAHRGRELLVVHVYDWRAAGSRVPLGGAYEQDARARAETIVAAAVADAEAASPSLTVRGEAVVGAPGAVLIRASEKAELVVVGSRGRGGIASLLLGSVSQQVATHAAGPVAVVRGRTDITGGPIVVGVDGSAGATEALRAAFDEAVARDAEIVAIRAYAPASPALGLGVGPYVEDREQRRAGERARLAEDVEPWLDKYPGVSIEQVVIDASAANVLTGVSSTAQLVMVGTRGHGGFAGLLLGSVGLQLLHHADCPVLVVRNP